MQTVPKVQTEALTPHDREVAAFVLREHADEMDAAKNSADDEGLPIFDPFGRCRQSALTVEMREIAHKLEWGG